MPYHLKIPGYDVHRRKLDEYGFEPFTPSTWSLQFKIGVTSNTRTDRVNDIKYLLAYVVNRESTKK